MNLLTKAQIQALHNIISEARNVVVTCHHNPDGDAIGSSLALARWLRATGKEATVVIPDAFPDFLAWLPETHTVVRHDKRAAEADLLLRVADTVFCLDFSAADRVGESMRPALLESKGRRVVIDHHEDPQIEADVLVSQPQMCSTAEMVFHVISQLGGVKDIDRLTATCLYCGMMTDTGNFSYNSASPDTYRVVAALLERGINKDRIYRSVYWTFTPSRMRLWGHVLQSFVVSDDGRSSYFTISRRLMKEHNFIRGDAEGLVNMPLQIRGMRLSISLREDTEKPRLVWVSLRSVDDFPCNRMAAEYFNGGGHLNAAGGRLYTTLAEAELTVQRAIRDFKY